MYVCVCQSLACIDSEDIRVILRDSTHPFSGCIQSRLRGSTIPSGYMIVCQSTHARHAAWAFMQAHDGKIEPLKMKGELVG